MNPIDVDVAIIGAGTAGLTARRQAEANGATVALIDPGPYGTTCARVGCMPSKLLIAAAEAAHRARHAALFGVDTTVSIDGRRVMQRVQAERDRFAGFVQRAIEELRTRGVLIPGRARFLDDHRLEVDRVDGAPPLVVRAGSVVIATGSRPFVPPPYRGLSRDVLLTTDEIFELPDLPDSLLVVGAGVIGMELGQAMARLGVRTTILSLGGRIAFIDSEPVNAEAIRIFRQELDLHPHHELHEVEEVDGGVSVRFTDFDGRTRTERYARVLMGAGRVPNWEGLGLENTRLTLDDRGRPEVNPYTHQVEDSHIFVAGDVAGHRPLLHEAADEGRLAGLNAARYPHVLAEPRKTPLSIMFTDPQVAVVGDRWPDLSCADHRVGVVDYGDQGRARVMGENRGMVRIAGAAGTGQLIAAQMIGPRVEHTAHLLAWAIQGRMLVSEALDRPFYHPVIEEGIRTALRDLQSKLHLSYKPEHPCEEWGAGT
ncbi:MAG: dihydrolipoyl dehydrogenase [Deltaproteobacteria bacterium]|nr:MAG: dihydrolipoyl dehydrogenase [Deltaproteobacteria bacterium]